LPSTEGAEAEGGEEAMSYANRKRTRQVFALIGLEHRGQREGNERLVCFVKDDQGLLVLWGTYDVDMRHIQELEHEVKHSGYPVTIECDWIQPDPYEAEHFGHRYWVWQSDHFRIIKPTTSGL
jgi:hypothetical protein